MLFNACSRLDEQKDFVNSLNVFPVPDGDTGTNMSLTFKSAIDDIQKSKSNSISEISKILSKGALMGARGNSGVILSQIFRGMANAFDGHDDVDSKLFAEGIMEGSKSAYKAVMRPTEGTILTIIRSAGEKAVQSKENDIKLLLREVCAYSEDILNKTPDMLPVLKKAKVVDSGGMGLLIILKGMQEALENDLKKTSPKAENINNVVKAQKRNIDNAEIKYGYCTEFIIKNSKGSAEDLKKEISPFGDCMIVIGIDDIIKVHIHTNDPGFILSKAVKLGELTKIKIDNMREEHREVLFSENEIQKEESEESMEADSEDNSEESKKYAFVTVAAGEGIKAIFKDLGADCVIEGGQTMNPSTKDILSSIDSIKAENIIVLPNNKNIIMAASQAAELSNKNVYVVPTKSIPQGISCMTVFNMDSSVEDNMNNMSEAIKSVSSASVTYAVRDTDMDGYNIKKGDVLGLIDGKISEVGKDIYLVCESLIKKLVSEDSSLISLFYGKDCDKDKVDALSDKLKNNYSDVDVQCFYGKQPLYYFILSVE